MISDEPSRGGLTKQTRRGFCTGIKIHVGYRLEIPIPFTNLSGLNILNEIFRIPATKNFQVSFELFGTKHFQRISDYKPIRADLFYKFQVRRKSGAPFILVEPRILENLSFHFIESE